MMRIASYRDAKPHGGKRAPYSDGKSLPAAAPCAANPCHDLLVVRTTMVASAARSA
jgi:hypothetical protein